MRGPGGFWHFKDSFHLLCVEQTWGRMQGDQLRRSRRDSRLQSGGEVFGFWVRPAGTAGGSCGPSDVGQEGGTRVKGDGFCSKLLEEESWEEEAGGRLGDRFGLVG